MSFTYQRTHKSVCIDTRPNLRSARPLFDSDSEDEDEYDGQLEQGHRPLALTYQQPPEPEPAGDPAWSGDRHLKLQLTSQCFITISPKKKKKKIIFIHSCFERSNPSPGSALQLIRSTVLTPSLLCSNPF